MNPAATELLLRASPVTNGAWDGFTTGEAACPDSPVLAASQPGGLGWLVGGTVRYWDYHALRPASAAILAATKDGAGNVVLQFDRPVYSPDGGDAVILWPPIAG